MPRCRRSGHAGRRAARRQHDRAAARRYRVLIGLALAVVVGLPLGILMGRFKPVENSSAARERADADPSSPGCRSSSCGSGSAIRSRSCVFYAALFPMLLNTWSGVRAVNPLWLRAAGAMGADERRCSGR